MQMTLMADDIAKPGALTGITIAVPETRELQMMTGMLQSLGATVLSCPMVGILDTPNVEAVNKWLQQLAAGEMDDLVLMTGDGVRRLLGFAERAGMSASVLAAFSKARKFTRGPKPVRALTEVGLRTDVPSTAPTTEGIIDTLSKLNLSGRRVGVQLYGEDPNLRLIDYLKSAGALAFPVAPYIYAPVADEERVADLIEKMASGQLHMIAFTSASQVKRIQEVAKNRKIEEKLSAAFQKTRVAAIGPVVAQELITNGVRVDLMPPSSFILKQFMQDIVAALGR